MWEDIFKKDSILFLIDKFIFIEKTSKKDKKTGKSYDFKNHFIWLQIIHVARAICGLYGICDSFEKESDSAC